MLIKSSLPNSLSTELSFVSDFRKQQNPELLCDWPHCAGNWQKSPNDKFPLDNCRENIAKISCSGLAEISRSNSDKSVKNMCTNFASKWNGFVYKRRRLIRNTATALSEENVIDFDEGNNDLNSSIVSTGNHLRYPLEHCSHIDTICPSPKSDVILTAPLEEFASSRAFCIFILKRHELLIRANNAPFFAEVLAVKDANISLSCMICNLLENPLKMLICDLCESAFHISCCHSKLKNPPVDYWYCQHCFTKGSKGEKTSGKLANLLSEHLYRKSYNREGPISRMLRDDQPYTSDIRVGKDFQVDIPQWFGPISEDCRYFNEHLELDLAECASLNKAGKPSQSSSFSNWVQCREVIHKSRKDTRIICGKWRRAPLFVLQTDNWDCSCSVLWDPIHADCSVPQELETDVILKHLKYFELLRPQLNITKKKTQKEADYPQ